MAWSILQLPASCEIYLSRNANSALHGLLLHLLDSQIQLNDLLLLLCTGKRIICGIWIGECGQVFPSIIVKQQQREISPNHPCTTNYSLPCKVDSLVAVEFDHKLPISHDISLNLEEKIIKVITFLPAALRRPVQNSLCHSLTHSVSQQTPNEPFNGL